MCDDFSSGHIGIQNLRCERIPLDSGLRVRPTSTGVYVSGHIFSDFHLISN